MKKRYIGIILTALLCNLLVGCSTETIKTNDTSPGDTMDTNAAVTEYSDTTEKKTDKTNDEKEAKEKDVFDDSEGVAVKNAAAKMPTGDAAEIQVISDCEELSEEEVEEIERAERDFKSPKTGILKNNAKSYYYYRKLPSAEQDLYDAMLLSVYDSYDVSHKTSVYVKENPASDAFKAKFNKVYECMLLDHPELFFIYNSRGGDFTYYYSEGSNTVYIEYNQPYKQYASEINEFNDAAERFLQGINLNDSEQGIARQIHDRLIQLVSYDYDVFRNNKGYDRAHTAYGALVENSSCIPNHAVCDGYSFAYIYLLQQAGIEAVFLDGDAGSNGDLGRHAWTIIKLDGKWYETDVTWDDYGSVDEHVDSSQDYYDYAKAAFSDSYYRELIEHYLYAVSTDTMNSFHLTDDYIYYFEDGWKVWLVGDSVHIRSSEIQGYYSKEVISMAPTTLSAGVEDTDFKTELSYEESEELSQNQPFYGIWYYASKDRLEAQKKADELTKHGFNARVYISDEWSNLNQERWYSVSAGTCSTKAEAEVVLQRAQEAGFSKVYIKYSGEYIGN